MASTVPVCGIDLGTTTSAASVYIPATKERVAKVVIVKLGKSTDTIPSVVCRSVSSTIWKAGDNAITEADKDREKTPLIKGPSAWLGYNTRRLIRRLWSKCL